MATTFKPKERPNYGEVLAQRAKEVFETIDDQLDGALKGHGGMRDYLLDILKETAKESFKAGIEVGMKKANPHARPVRQA